MFGVFGTVKIKIKYWESEALLQITNLGYVRLI